MKKPSALLLIALAPLIGLVLAQSKLFQRHSAYSDIRNQLHTKIEQTRSHQRMLSRELGSDPSIAQNLQIQLHTAVGRILSGYVQPGKIDQLMILDTKCHVLAHSGQGISLAADCPSDQLKNIMTTTTHWHTNQDGPSLYSISPITSTSGQNLFLKVSTHLDESWLQATPRLRQGFDELGLSLRARSSLISRVLWQSGDPNSSEAKSFQVFANDPWVLLFPSLLQAAPFDMNVLLFITLSLFFTAFAYLLQTVERRDRRQDRALRELILWAHDLEHQNCKESAPKLPPTNLDVSHLKAEMGKTIKKNLETQVRLEHQNTLLQQQIVKLEGRLAEHQAEQALFHQAQSLQQQIQTCAAAYIEKIEDTLSLGEDLSHLASKEIFKPAQRLFALSSQWDIELSKLSPRKFLRSLSERINEGGVSELDLSLDILIQETHQVSNCAVNLSMLTQKLIAELKATLHIARHWQGMMLSQKQKVNSLLKLVEESQALIQLQDQAVALHYDNLMEEQSPLVGIEIAGSILTSALFHAHLSLIEAARDKGAVQLYLSTQMKKRSDRHVLVISLRSDGDDQLIPGSELPAKASQHLSLAIQLLQGHDIKITQLPPLPGVYALALMWHPKVDHQSADLTLHPSFDSLPL